MSHAPKLLDQVRALLRIKHYALRGGEPVNHRYRHQ